MEVSVVCFGVLRDFLPDPTQHSAVIRVAEGSTIKDVLAHLGAPERSAHMCLVGGERVGLDEELREGVEVTLMPPFSGGANS